MRYSFFISHAQMDAASTAKSFYNVANRLGAHCWYDMEQAELTLEGMKQGVRDCDTFLLILTQNVLTRWFCQQEILTAIEESKQVGQRDVLSAVEPPGPVLTLDVLDADAMVRSIDADGNGEIDVDEFIALVRDNL